MGGPSQEEPVLQELPNTMNRQHQKGETDLQCLGPHVAHSCRSSGLGKPRRPGTPRRHCQTRSFRPWAWPEEVQRNLKEVGYKPPRAQAEGEAEEVRTYLRTLTASEEVTPSKQPVRPANAGTVLLGSSSTLRTKRLICSAA